LTALIRILPQLHEEDDRHGGFPCHIEKADGRVVAVCRGASPPGTAVLAHPVPQYRVFVQKPVLHYDVLRAEKCYLGDKGRNIRKPQKAGFLDINAFGSNKYANPKQTHGKNGKYLHSGHD
jgi:hypothetical protein